MITRISNKHRALSNQRLYNDLHMKTKDYQTISGSKRFVLFLFFLATTLFPACKTNTLIPEPQNYIVNPYGALISFKDVIKAEIIKGELIEADEHSFKVLTEEGLKEYKPEDTSEMKLIVSRTSGKTDMIKIWGILNPFTTIAHGFYLILSLPVNLAISASTIAISEKAYYYIPLENYDYMIFLYKFARYPQGMPEGIEIEIKEEP